MMDALSRPDRDVLSAMGLEPLVSLRRVAVNENMIRAAARYWDSRDHVFRFGDDELSPTFTLLLRKEKRKEIGETLDLGSRRL